jgi:hypothetical protein
LEAWTALRGSAPSKLTVAVVIAVLGAFVFLGSACGESSSSAKQPTPSAMPIPTPAASPPPGGPVPAQLLGAWFLPPAAVDARIGCQEPLNAGTCSLRLNLTATKYSFAGTLPSGPGKVVVNNTEIDFFSAPQCTFQLPEGVGRYTWTLTGGVLHLTPLNDDPCGRSQYLDNESYYRTP